MSQISKNASTTTNNSTSTSGSAAVSSATLPESNSQSFDQPHRRRRSGSLFIERSHPSPSMEAESYNVYIDDSKYGELLKEDTNSSGTDGTQVFEDARDENFHEESHKVLEKSILDLVRRDPEAAGFPPPPPCPVGTHRNSSNGSSAETNPNGHSSSGTISTSVLLNMGSAEKHVEAPKGDYMESSSMKSFEKVKVRPSSSYYLPLEDTSPQQERRETISKVRNPNQVQGVYPSFSSMQYDDGFAPSIEEAIEAAKNRVSNDGSNDRFTDKVFIPHEFQIPKKAWNGRLVNRSPKLRTPRNHSLLTDILKPSEAIDHANTLTSNILHDPTKEGLISQIQDRRQRENNQPVLNPVHSPQSAFDIAMDAVDSQNRLYEREYVNNTDSHLVLEEIGRGNHGTKQYKYQKNPKKGDEEGISTFYMHTMPIQRIDSSSVYSFDSQTHGFSEIYSISRIITTLCICLLVPPLFFFFSVNGDSGISNYRLMRIIMNYEHKIGLLKGFEWDIDVRWFRTLCLVLGCIELLFIFTGIGVGFGVGMTRK
ncbi:Bud9p SKDI_07G2960 [Saccharomyces kudriavzevii IFO 1802]|uniref:BUD9-like protein n=1 Tax=Saccharomyces kudriavzevii (strain ATCC MYA-4449 / AS 2.2408 / CBS 8840 / NBRC 1802 / NCYC 2889) TaxID=226230 RepID=A0AA35JIB3_SACK1|nr:uncharacterized protein SKDI_07G2960 [Saccharomyces kudriavzevii IFO 1802]CAI4062203.1 hypothetical protein SKDI_07G2960 [Saccharomyces kudriavzevii IFO 1802]